MSHRTKSLFSITKQLFSLKISSSLHTDSEAALASQLSLFLKTCTRLPHGQQVHAQAITNGLTGDKVLSPKILGMYVLCGSYLDAKNMFNALKEDLLCYALPWNWMIRCFTMMGSFEFALLFYFKMLGFGACPDKYTFPYVVKACGGLKSLSLGEEVHSMIRRSGLDEDIFVGSSLVKFYAENGCIESARSLFDKMVEKDSVLWNVMLNGYAKIGDCVSALRVYGEMRSSEVKPNSVTFACVLAVCASETMIEFGRQLHGLVVKCGFESDPPVANTLLTVYAKCRCLLDAHIFFRKMPQNDLVTWNAMISGYVQNGFMHEAACLFHEMISKGVKPDSITFASFLPSILEVASLSQGKEIHGYIVRHVLVLDVFLKSALIDIYCKCRDVEMALKVFDQCATIDVVICTAMISGCVLNGMSKDALGIFRRLLEDQLKPNSITLASMLPACAGLTALKLGKELHTYSLKNGHTSRCYVGSAITDMYAKCGRLDLAHQVFKSTDERDAVSWNSMITSCSQNSKPEEAIDLFRQMGMIGTKYDCVSISAALSACANLPALRFGKEIHGFMMRSALESDLFAESALIDMYAKCGDMGLARCVFDTMQEKNEVSWNSIIAAYGNHGLLDDCLHLFYGMKQNGFHPDHVTFLAILSACAHAGQVDEGIHHFHSMTYEYAIIPRMEHYACMVDAFGRAGRLGEAFETIKSMPFDADAGVWGTLLGACRVHGNVELAQLCSTYLLNLDPENSGYYVLLSNLHADSGQWDSVRNIRNLMKNKGVEKVPGYSWLEVNQITHIFVADDKSHPASAQIYSLLKHLLLELTKEGYSPQVYLPNHPETISSGSTLSGEEYFWPMSRTAAV